MILDDICFIKSLAFANHVLIGAFLSLLAALGEGILTRQRLLGLIGNTRCKFHD
jgi:hypothetical protein